MKIITASNGKKTVKISKSDWTDIGKQANWMDAAKGAFQGVKNIGQMIIDPMKTQNACGKVMQYLNTSQQNLQGLLQSLQQVSDSVNDPSMKQQLNQTYQSLAGFAQLQNNITEQISQIQTAAQAQPQAAQPEAAPTSEELPPAPSSDIASPQQATPQQV